MSKMLKAAIVGLGLLGTVTAAEALPALSNVGTPLLAGSGAQVEKVVVIVRRAVRPRVIVRRPLVRPFVRRPLVRALRRL